MKSENWCWYSLLIDKLTLIWFWLIRNHTFPTLWQCVYSASGNIRENLIWHFTECFHLKTLSSKEENFLPKLGWMTTTLWCFDPVLTKYSDPISEIGGRGVVICYWNWGVILCKIKTRTMRPISSSTQISASHDCAAFSHLILAMLYCSSPWIQLTGY